MKILSQARLTVPTGLEDRAWSFNDISNYPPQINIRQLYTRLYMNPHSLTLVMRPIGLEQHRSRI